MQAISSGQVWIITAAAAGAAWSVRWWVGRCHLPHIDDADAPTRDRVEELHWAFRDRTVPSADAQADVLHAHWSRLHPLHFAPPGTPAPTARRSGLSRGMD
ncbi:hypothetical protein ACWD1Z_35775 [Streptomyces sp. NPDC002784]